MSGPSPSSASISACSASVRPASATRSASPRSASSWPNDAAIPAFLKSCQVMSSDAFWNRSFIAAGMIASTVSAAPWKSGLSRLVKRRSYSRVAGFMICFTSAEPAAYS